MKWNWTDAVVDWTWWWSTQVLCQCSGLQLAGCNSRPWPCRSMPPTNHFTQNLQHHCTECLEHIDDFFHEIVRCCSATGLLFYLDVGFGIFPCQEFNQTFIGFHHVCCISYHRSLEPDVPVWAEFLSQSWVAGTGGSPITTGYPKRENKQSVVYWAHKFSTTSASLFMNCAASHLVSLGVRKALCYLNQLMQMQFRLGPLTHRLVLVQAHYKPAERRDSTSLIPWSERLLVGGWLWVFLFVNRHFLLLCWYWFLFIGVVLLFLRKSKQTE